MVPQVNGVLGLGKQPLDPNAMAYASIIKSYASVGDEGGAEDVLRRLKEKNIKPDVVMYNALLSAYATNGNWQVRPHTSLLRQLTLPSSHGIQILWVPYLSCPWWPINDASLIAGCGGGAGPHGVRGDAGAAERGDVLVAHQRLRQQGQQRRRRERPEPHAVQVRAQLIAMRHPGCLTTVTRLNPLPLEA